MAMMNGTGKAEGGEGLLCVYARYSMGRSKRAPFKIGTRGY